MMRGMVTFLWNGLLSVRPQIEIPVLDQEIRPIDLLKSIVEDPTAVGTRSQNSDTKLLAVLESLSSCDGSHSAKNIPANQTAVSRVFQWDTVAIQWITLGICTMKMLFPPMVDPVQKMQVKRNCLLLQVSLKS